MIRLTFHNTSLDHPRNLYINNVKSIVAFYDHIETRVIQIDREVKSFWGTRIESEYESESGRDGSVIILNNRKFVVKETIEQIQDLIQIEQGTQ